MSTVPPAQPTLKPSHARYYVLVFAVTLAILSYIDRVAISKAAPYISHDTGLSKQQMGAVFGAFALSYALAEIPSGWMGDLLGAQRADAHRAVVVVLHGVGDDDVELHFTVDQPVPIRRRRGGLLPEPDESLQHPAPAA